MIVNMSAGGVLELLWMVRGMLENVDVLVKVAMDQSQCCLDVVLYVCVGKFKLRCLEEEEKRRSLYRRM